LTANLWYKSLIVSPTARTLAGICALVGLAAMLAAAYVHYHLVFDPRYASFCDINTTVNCTQVYLSRYSTVYGVPVSIYGAIWFVGVLFLLVAGSVGPQRVRESIPGYLFALSTAGLAVVLYLGYVSIAVLKVYCYLCLTADAAVIGLFLVSGAATSFPMTTLPRRAVTDLQAWVSSPLAIAVTALFFGGAVSAVAFFPREGSVAGSEPGAGASQASTQTQRSEFERWYTAQPRVPLIVPAEGAKVLIVDFSDFQCPFCRQAFVRLKPLVAKYNAQQPGSIRLVLKDYPLNTKCNVNVQNGGPHPAACEAAVAVRLAKATNREDAMEEWFFSNQEAMTPDSVRQAAREVGHVTDFDAKYASTLELVKSDIAFGHSLGVTATPTIFINGVKIAGVLALEYFDQAIALELQRASR
jgi:uncharacterized membrane protein/protein-disulfide isomerase